MRDCGISFRLIRTQGIGIVAQSADLHSGLFHAVPNLMDQMFGQIGDINMRHSGISTLGLSGGPAADFYTVESNTFRSFKDFAKGKIRKNGTDKTELHLHHPCGMEN